MPVPIRENISLRPYNTFGIDVRARYFAGFSSSEELGELIHTGRGLPLIILGGGSNILFTRDFDGWVLKNEIKGIELVHEDEEYYYVRAGGGENWHRLVRHCLERNWAGIENLSLIPGSVGAAPMQNIGAYGVELSDVFLNLEAYHLRDRKTMTFTAADCGFGYRDSVFKNKYRNQFAILNITLRLYKHPVFHTSYGAIAQELEKMNVKELTIKAVSDAVIRIRTSKLPDPAVIGNAGSFFKNPLITKQQFEKLKKEFPGLVAFPQKNGTVKLAAGWLIEQCGPQGTEISWKGYRRGDAGCHARQALVLVNYGKATGKEIYDLSEEIRQSVKKKFGVVLEREVNII